MAERIYDGDSKVQSGRGAIADTAMTEDDDSRVGWW
jgi:hypothetical protein